MVAAADDQVGLRVRVALLRSSVLTQGRKIGLDLFSSCVQAGVISPALGEPIAGQQEWPEDVSKSLLVVFNELPSDDKRRLVQSAKAAALAIPGGYSRATALSAVAAELGPGERESTLQQALAAALAIGDEYYRASTLSAVAAQLGPGERASALQESLAAALAIGDEYDRARALSGIAAQLGPGDRESTLREALAAALAIREEFDRAPALSALAAQLGLGEREIAFQEALAAALAIGDVLPRIRPHRGGGAVGTGRPGVGITAGVSRRSGDWEWKTPAQLPSSRWRRS